MFYDKIDFPIRTRVIYNLKHRYAIRSKFGNKFLTSLFKLVLEVKGSMYSTIQENLLLYCRKFSPFVVVLISFITETINFTIKVTLMQISKSPNMFVSIQK